jgi:hypothetical protein
VPWPEPHTVGKYLCILVFSLTRQSDTNTDTNKVVRCFCHHDLAANYLTRYLLRIAGRRAARFDGTCPRASFSSPCQAATGPRRGRQEESRCPRFLELEQRDRTILPFTDFGAKKVGAGPAADGHGRA